MSARVRPMLRICVKKTELDAATDVTIGLMTGERYACACCLVAAGVLTWSVTRKGKGVGYALCEHCSETFAKSEDEKVWRAVESKIDANLDVVCR